ncbi:hypothetical protein BOX15_Mlig001272g2, partial [Macrostomum lignano]
NPLPCSIAKRPNPSSKTEIVFESSHMSNDSLSEYRPRDNDKHKQQGRRQQQRQQQLVDADQAEAVAPVEVSKFSVEAPKYDSPNSSRQEVRVAAAGAASSSRFDDEKRSTPKQAEDGSQNRREIKEERGGATYKAAPVSTGAMQQQQTPRQREEEPSNDCGCCECLLKFISIILIILTFPFSLCSCIKIVQQYERAVIFRLGRIQGEPKGPGLFFIMPCIDKMRVIDLRTLTFDVPPQEILTKDSVTVAVDAVVYYRIFDPIRATVDIEDVHRATRLLAQTTLRNTLGTKTLHEVLAEREIIAQTMQESLDTATDPWGVKVERVEVKDVRLPVQMQRAMAAEAEALREAKAKVIAAEGEQKASRALKEAADVIDESPAALQLRYLQTLNSIAAEKNSTILFPLPMEMLRGMGAKR